MIVNLCGRPKIIKLFTGTPNKCDLSEKITFNVVSDPKVQNVFFQCNSSRIKSFFC